MRSIRRSVSARWLLVFPLLATAGCPSVSPPPVIPGGAAGGAALPIDVTVADLCTATGQGRQCKPSDGSWSDAGGLIQEVPPAGPEAIADRYLLDLPPPPWTA